MKNGSKTNPGGFLSWVPTWGFQNVVGFGHISKNWDLNGSSLRILSNSYLGQPGEHIHKVCWKKKKIATDLYKYQQKQTLLPYSPHFGSKILGKKEPGRLPGFFRKTSPNFSHLSHGLARGWPKNLQKLRSCVKNWYQKGQFGLPLWDPKLLEDPCFGKKKECVCQKSLKDFWDLVHCFLQVHHANLAFPFSKQKFIGALMEALISHTTSQAPMLQPRYRVSPKHRSTLGLAEVIKLAWRSNVWRFLVWDRGGLRNNSSCACLLGCFKDSYGIMIYSPYELPWLVFCSATFEAIIWPY